MANNEIVTRRPAGAMSQRQNGIASVTLRDVRLLFKNFEGREGQYNRAGDRNFLALLPTDVAAAMAEEGWNIKTLKPRADAEPDEPLQDYIQVSIKWGKGQPPNVVLVTAGGRNKLDEETVDILDWAPLARVDLIIRPYQWDVNGKTGVKAYLKTLFAFMEEDELEREYASIPENKAAGTLQNMEATATPLDSDDELVYAELMD